MLVVECIYFFYNLFVTYLSLHRRLDFYARVKLETRAERRADFHPTFVILLYF